MSGGYRLVIVAAGGLALFTALFVGAYFGALNAPHYSQQPSRSAYRAAHAEQHDPSQIDRDRAGLPYFAERIASGPDPKDGGEREYRDLAAQESMSVWAFWMLVTSAAGVVTTAIGTGFLLWQIILTRQAVEDTGEATEAMQEANEIAKKAQRPWLSVEAGITTQSIEIIDEYEMINVDCWSTVTIHNSGGGPALDVYRWARIFHEENFAGCGGHTRFSETDYRIPVGNIPPGGSITFEVYGRIPLPYDVSARPQTIYSSLGIVIEYKSPDGASAHRTAQSYQICKQVLTGGALSIVGLYDLTEAQKHSGRFAKVPCELAPYSGGIMT